MKQVDHIVVGQGIAGTVLAHTLRQHGRSVQVIDDNTLSHSSQVAAGNFNPIVFKRLVRSWMAEELIPFADRFYRQTEQLLKQEFYWKKQIVKIFADEKEREFWLQKAALPENKAYLLPTIDRDFFPNIVHNPEGAAFVQDAANLFVSKFLSDFRNYFHQQGMLLPEKFEFSRFSETAEGVHYKDLQASSIFFCEGHLVSQNPYFKELPMKPAKGEVLVVKIPGLETDKIINKGVYLLPIGGDLFLVGATYDWIDRTDAITEKARAEIVEKLGKLIKVPFEVVDQHAGVRPSVNDRRPVIGMHPDHPRIGIFNGMGTKGVMLAPYFAEQLAVFLEGKGSLHPEADLRRFFA